MYDDAKRSTKHQLTENTILNDWCQFGGSTRTCRSCLQEIDANNIIGHVWMRGYEVEALRTQCKYWCRNIMCGCATRPFVRNSTLLYICRRYVELLFFRTTCRWKLACSLHGDVAARYWNERRKSICICMFWINYFSRLTHVIRLNWTIKSYVMSLFFIILICLLSAVVRQRSVTVSWDFVSARC